MFFADRSSGRQAPPPVQWPLNRAGRRSMNEAMPSWKSSVAWTALDMAGIASCSGSRMATT